MAGGDPAINPVRLIENPPRLGDLGGGEYFGDW